MSSNVIMLACDSGLVALLDISLCEKNVRFANYILALQIQYFGMSKISIVLIPA